MKAATILSIANGCTSAPDGRIDEYASRNTINSNRVVFAFTNGASTRFVSVELDGKRRWLAL
jgi:hypothetical protein